MYVLDQSYGAVTGQTNRFYVLEEAIAAAAKWTRARNRNLKIWEYRNGVRAFFGSVLPDGTLIRPHKEISAIVATLHEKGHKDLADDLLNLK